MKIDLFFSTDLLMSAVNFIRWGIVSANQIYTIKSTLHQKLILKKLKAIDEKCK